jgi:UDP-N-acetylglucosamine/UDP-N-acetyl-alpha-D-glucosaminouronate 4-epimerase
MKTGYKNKKVLVTGGAGFIGSHLVEKLVDLDAQVTVLDNLSTGSLENLAHVKASITFIEGDIIDVNLCHNVAHDQDYIFHLAAFISVPESVKNPQRCYQTNILGTLYLLQAAHESQVKRLIFSSSAAVYGNQGATCTEDMKCKPESPYGYSKLIGECLCREFHKTFNLDTVMLRYFNVYGPRQNPHAPYAGVVAQFRETMQHNKPLSIFGNGTQTRDFIPVEKVVKANLTLGIAPKHRVSGQVFNCAVGKSISLLELIERLKEEFPDFNAEITFNPARPGDITHSRADTSRYQKILTSLVEQNV